jgi:hypothetical protein
VSVACRMGFLSAPEKADAPFRPCPGFDPDFFSSGFCSEEGVPFISASTDPIFSVVRSGVASPANASKAVFSF